MPVREWRYKGHRIEANPNGSTYKYLVWLSASRLIAARSFAELTAELDRL